MDPLIFLRNFVREPRLAGVDLEGAELLSLHRQVLMEKPMMRTVFAEFYRLCRSLDDEYFSGTGFRVELGAGSSFMKTLYPEVVATDFKQACHLDKCIDAQNMDLENDSVRAFYGLNCFHHFSAPRSFFSELCRVLQPGGGCVLIEPYHSWLGKLLYRRLFDSESFDMDQAQWESPGQGVMERANQALSYIVFERDYRQFGSEFPELSIVAKRLIPNYPRYLLSGGLNFRQLVPQRAEGLVCVVERFMRPFLPMFALHYVVVLRKNA
ncbi:MAG: methyltransferase domain-containing protein [Candidatus Eremiobacteraeota bacterium]|nr:methyltransferase domain-containing protein [Candidatus Eremiobacteraeota bacterium]MCW5868968.1 methyltransferase domain-containing protein [Candidatus Eremiobacteraeota bacterium]